LKASGPPADTRWSSVGEHQTASSSNTQRLKRRIPDTRLESLSGHAGTFDAMLLAPIMYVVVAILGVLTFGLGLYRSWQAGSLEGAVLTAGPAQRVARRLRHPAPEEPGRYRKHVPQHLWLSPM
jgi:cytochrome c-type biogenesis protein CcmH/NrfG